MKRAREEQPQRQVPYNLQLAKLYLDNGNYVLAEHSYNKWYDSLTQRQKIYISARTPAWRVNWQLHQAMESTMNGNVLAANVQQSFQQMLNQVIELDYSHIDDDNAIL